MIWFIALVWLIAGLLLTCKIIGDVLLIWLGDGVPAYIVLAMLIFGMIVWPITVVAYFYHTLFRHREDL